MHQIFESFNFILHKFLFLFFFFDTDTSVIFSLFLKHNKLFIQLIILNIAEKKMCVARIENGGL